ncbi:unnamed protein product [Clavelina lepadiformis]|uniref:Uncharacterized protein n=1 Tax=Clavelina lepadiformis TaxID=159417 RepID=A0ABP0FAX6_CLALP
MLFKLARYTYKMANLLLISGLVVAFLASDLVLAREITPCCSNYKQRHSPICRRICMAMMALYGKGDHSIGVMTAGKRSEMYKSEDNPVTEEKEDGRFKTADDCLSIYPKEICKELRFFDKQQEASDGSIYK